MQTMTQFTIVSLQTAWKMKLNKHVLWDMGKECPINSTSIGA